MALAFACIERENRFPELGSRNGPRRKHAGRPHRIMQIRGQLIGHDCAYPAVLTALCAGSVDAAAPRTLEGTYGLTGTGACLASPIGFYPNNVAFEPSSDGSMTVDMLLDTYAATYLTGPSAGLHATFVTVPPLSPTWVWSGTFSRDHKTLLLNNGDTPSRLRFSNGAEVNVICQFQRVLTRLTP